MGMKMEICTKGCGARNVILKFSVENGVSVKGFEQRRVFEGLVSETM